MDADLTPVYERIKTAVRPEDLFSELHMLLPPRLLEEHLKSEVAAYRAVLDAKLYGSLEDQEAAEWAHERFEQFLTQALASAAGGTYSVDGFSNQPLSTRRRKVTVNGVTYEVGKVLHQNQFRSVYEARFGVTGGTGGAIIKLANSPTENLSLNNEIRILDQLYRKVDDKELGYWRFLPFLYGRFSAGSRLGVIERYFEGVTLDMVSQDPLHRSGLHQRHMVWVLDRTLNVLGYVHRQGVVHGSIDPERIRIRPSNHNVLLTGWSRAVYKPAVTGEIVRADESPFLAPEVKRGGVTGPWTDIYSLGKTMIWLLGGDPEGKTMPEMVEPKLQRFLQNMVRENPRARPNDAWQLFKAENRLKDSLWERRFLHLELTRRS